MAHQHYWCSKKSQTSFWVTLHFNPFQNHPPRYPFHQQKNLTVGINLRNKKKPLIEVTLFCMHEVHDLYNYLSFVFNNLLHACIAAIYAFIDESGYAPPNSLFRLSHFLETSRKKMLWFSYLLQHPWFHAKTSFCDCWIPDFQSQARKILGPDWGMNCDSGFVVFCAFGGWQEPLNFLTLKKSKALVMNQPCWSMTLSTWCEIDMK